MEEEFDIMRVPGLISSGERTLLKETSELVVKEFGPKVVLVNVGIHTGGSIYCMRAGAPEAKLFGFDVNGWKYVRGDLDILNMTLVQGDSVKTGKSFKGPIHAIFIDGGHSYRIVKADTLNLASHVVPGGYVLYHDAFYEKDNKWYRQHKGIEETVEELLVPDPNWEEQERVDTVRWFKRLS